MTRLEQAAMTATVLSMNEVQASWCHPMATSERQIKDLCLSHERLRADLDAARKRAGIQWLPIADAPKDGTMVLLFQGSTIAHGYWAEQDQWWYICAGRYMPAPTHFAIVTGPEVGR